MPDYRPPWGAATVAAAAALVLYVLTLAPTTGFWDASEYIATAHILGIPHPPGNPLFVVVGRAWELLLAPLGLSVAVRINLLAAVTTAASVGFLFLVAHRLLVGFGGEGRWALVGAAASAVLGGTAYTVWNQATVNEKVYTLSVLVIMAVTWLAVRWYDRRGLPGSLRYPLAIVYLLALGSTNHLMSVLPAAALLVLALLARAPFLRSRAFWIRAVPLVVVGLSFNFFLPIRAEDHPPINEGEPVCESLVEAGVAIYTGGRAGCPALASSLTREQYAKPPVTERMAPLASQLLNYWQYFEWQWGRGLDPSEVPGGPRLPLALLFLAFGVGGLWVAWRSDRLLFAYLATLTFTLTFGLVYYLNFRYGYSLAPEVTDSNLHEVRERDYFFVASFLLWGLLAGMGLAGAWRKAAEAMRGRPALVLTSPILILALLPGLLNHEWASRSGDYAARDWAYDLLMSAEPYGIVFTNGDNDTFPLWYLQEVEGLRQDVTVIVVQYLYTEWYAGHLQLWSTPCAGGGGPEGGEPCQRLFEPDEAPDFYTAPPAPPERAIVSIPREQMGRIGSGEIPQELTLSLGEVGVTFPAGTYLDRGHRLALAIIHDSVEERPIYFIGRSGLLSRIGMEEMSVREGLLTRLVPRAADAEAPEGWVRIEERLGGERFDLERSLALVEEVYTYRGLRDRDVWADRSTLNIPWHFYVLHLQLAGAVEQAGLSDELVDGLLEDADAFLTVARGGRRGIPAGG